VTGIQASAITARIFANSAKANGVYLNAVATYVANAVGGSVYGSDAGVKSKAGLSDGEVVLNEGLISGGSFALICSRAALSTMGRRLPAGCSFPAVMAT